MANKLFYSPGDFSRDVRFLASKIRRENYAGILGVPRGGVPLAAALSAHLDLNLITTQKYAESDPASILVVDDILDSGATRAKYAASDFACLHARPHSVFQFEEKNEAVTHVANLNSEDWIVYFWEEGEIGSIDQQIVRILQYLGEDPNREGLLETPSRVVKSWETLYGGYAQDPADVFKVFTEDKTDQLVLLKDIEFYSTCEHHMLPFVGKAHVAYIPDGKVLGVSKLARLLEIFARRLQIQERIGEQVTSALMAHLQPKGAACFIEAQHMCMSSRGVGKQKSSMVTSSLTGVFLTDSAARSELLTLIKN